LIVSIIGNNFPSCPIIFHNVPSFPIISLSFPSKSPSIAGLFGSERQLPYATLSD
jgi:hypothetical protein